VEPMTSITTHTPLPVDADTAWAAVRDVGNAHQLFAGVLVDAHLDGDGERVVTFADGLVVRERIIDVDDTARRVAYSVQDLFSYHHASMAVTPEPDGTSTLTWTTDLLPDDAASIVEPLMRSGAAAAAASLRG
jgi:hypothetical protein